MSTNPKNDSNNQEIDLSQISRNIGRGFQNFTFNFMSFFLKNALIILILFIVGVGLGFLLDRSQKSYNHEIIVIPNFGSSDYLYGKVELINSKIKEGDTVFLKNMGLKYPKNISKLKIEPIIDPYDFIRDREDNFELMKLMSEDGSIEKVLKDRVTSKNYSHHLITFSTKGKATDASTFEPLLANLNDNEYLKIIQQKAVENIKQKMIANEQTLTQIDALLNRYGSQIADKGSLVYYNENTQLEEVLKAKYNLVSEQGNRKIELVNCEKIIKDISIIPNIEKSSTSKLLLPFVLIVLFIFGKLFYLFYKNQYLRYRKENV